MSSTRSMAHLRTGHGCSESLQPRRKTGLESCHLILACAMLLGIFLAGLRAALVLGMATSKETYRFTPANSFAAMRACSWIFANHGFHLNS